MKILILLYALAALAGLDFTSRACAEPLTPDQAREILEKLEKMQAGIDADKNSVLVKAVAAFREGAASDRAALELYVNCYRELNFTRNEARQAEYLEWKERNKEKHGEDNFQKALRLQLQYLILSMRAAEETEPDERARIVADLERFVDQTVSAATGIAEDIAKEEKAADDDDDRRRRSGGRNGDDATASMGLLRQSVLSTVFAEAYELDRSLGHLRGSKGTGAEGDQVPASWSFTPLDLAGIYSSTILPYYGAIGPGEMGRAWDRWIEYEVRLAKATKSLADYNEFTARNLPEMRWKKSVYFYQVGFQVEGAEAMMKLLAENRGHPQLSDWHKEFKGLLSKNVAPPTPKDAPSE